MSDNASLTGGMSAELSRLLGAPIEATEPYWMLHELWDRLPPCAALGAIAAGMQELGAKDAQIERLRDELSEAISLLMEAQPGEDCAYADWLGARREFMTCSALTPNAGIEAAGEARRASNELLARDETNGTP